MNILQSLPTIDRATNTDNRWIDLTDLCDDRYDKMLRAAKLLIAGYAGLAGLVSESSTAEVPEVTEVLAQP